MNFYRIKKKSVLHGFNDPILDTPIVGKRLLDIHQEYISSVGGVLIDVDSSEAVLETSCFVFSADLYFTKKFLDQAKDGKAVSAAMLQAYLPAIEMIDNIVQGGPAFVQQLRSLQKRAKNKR